MNINGETKIIGFLGATFKTSRIYALYNAAFAALHLNFVYIPLPFGDVEKAVEGIRNMRIAAVGVTVPFKISILPFLDGLDRQAKRVRAVNVVINDNGKLIGGNTDGEGGVLALKEKTALGGKGVLLLGAGGAARAIAFSLIDNGADVTIVNRTVAAAGELATSAGCRFDQLTSLSRHIKNADILINATTVGMGPNTDKSLVPKALLRPDLTVLDVVSNPKETQLVSDARSAGCTVVSADRMLLWQAALKFKLFTGVEAPISVMETALKETEAYGR
ncbi:MAG TPA: shikimate dehydrogenase [Patescibacteria group bacterium]|jgi:shikimate dehydrogenase|nr:shikimate dehydrogenase [Patescibacteria group bacterium]